jgi:hypothetical protein
MKLEQQINEYLRDHDPSIDALLEYQHMIGGYRFNLGEAAKKKHDEAIISENNYKASFFARKCELIEAGDSAASAEAKASKELSDHRKEYKLLEAQYQGMKISLQTSGDVLSAIQQRISVLKKEQETSKHQT